MKQSCTTVVPDGSEVRIRADVDTTAHWVRRLGRQGKRSESGLAGSGSLPGKRVAPSPARWTHCFASLSGPA